MKTQSKQAELLNNINERISDGINFIPGMKMSVVWRQLDSSVKRVAAELSQFNGALAKTLPEMKKREMAQFFNATIDGKYIKFTDGSQARY